MKKNIVIMMSLVLAVSLSACGNTIGDMDLESGQSAIYVHEDGIVSYGVAESFDKDYYDEDALESKIKEEVSNYNNSDKASVSDAVKVEDFDVSGKVATMVLEFATDYDFLGYVRSYNKIDADKFYIGTIADNSKCKIKGDFISPDKKNTIKGKDVKEMSEAHIIVVKEQYNVQIDGEILYTSTNCEINEEGIVTTANENDGLSYIVYNYAD